MDRFDIVLSILAIVGFLIGFPQLWGSDWKRLWQYHYNGIVSWSTVNRSILRIADELRKSEFRPSIIIGVGRGGIICAGLLCSDFTSEELVERSRRKENNLRSPKIKLEPINSTIFLKDLVKQGTGGGKINLSPRVDKIELSDLDINIPEREKVLIIVGQNFTGSTLEKAVDLVLNKGAVRNSIKTAALLWHKHKKIGIVHDPDVFGAIVPLGKTVPWKLHEINTDRY